jgi:hypothetical protein
MSTPPKYFKRQSGEMVVVSTELQKLVAEAKEALEAVKTMPPPAFYPPEDEDVEGTMPTLPPTPLPKGPLEEEVGPTEEAKTIYSIVRPVPPRPAIRPIKKPTE